MAKKKIPELKIELINERANYLYMSLIEYKREKYLCVINSVKPDEIGAYVLDYAEQESIDIQKFFYFTTRWFYGKSDKHPLSVELSKHGLTEWSSPIFKTFDTAYVSRIVGHAFTYKGLDKTKVRRRRIVPIPEGIEIRFKK